ncbi:MAG: hypothetical protein KBA71_04845 [Opitutaceae bacterium]|nr:hypothetical protein [Opitutaceae bacterium]
MLALAGCQTYTMSTANRDSAVRSGSIERAVQIADLDAEKHRTGNDAVLYRLEQGSILRQAALAGIAAPDSIAPPAPDSSAATAGDGSQAGAAAPSSSADFYFKKSLEAFNAADERVSQFEEQARVKLGSSTVAMFTTQANTPYTGRAYDRVMMNAYKALDFLQLGDFDAARVELNRALQRQRDAVAENARRIEEATEEAQRAREGRAEDNQRYDVDKARSDSMSGPAFAEVEAELDARIKPYGDYVNPFVVFLDGLYFVTRAENGSDLERARKSFERVAGMAPDNPYARADWQMAEAAANGRLPTGLTYVIFEAGSAPYRESKRIDLPVFPLTGKVSYVGAAFPKLHFQAGPESVLSVVAGGSAHTTSLVSSMDSVVARDFRNEWPAIITKTILTTVTKAAVDGVIQKQAKDKWGITGQLVAKAATVAWGTSTNLADTRTWRSLPREFQYLRLTTPADRKLTISSGSQSRSVDILPGGVNVVYVKMNDVNSPLLVSQFALTR